LYDIELYFTKNGTIWYDYQIPLDAGSSMNVSYSFGGTSKIAPYEENIEYDLLPQLSTQVQILSNLEQQGFAGEYIFSIKLMDENDNPLTGKQITFEIVKTNQDGSVVLESILNKSVNSNEEGIASFSYTFEEVGYYSVKVYYQGNGIYAPISTDKQMEVEIDDYWSLIQKNYDTILIVIGSIIAAGLLMRQYYILPKRERRRKALMDIHRRFADVENVQYMLVIHKKNGMSIFSWSFTEIPIDETLISGFLSAIGSFGDEIGNKVKKKQNNGSSKPNLEGKTEFINGADQMMTEADAEAKGLEELAYKQFKIALVDAKYVKTAVLLLKKPSDSLKKKIGNFNSALETEFEDQLANWKGKTPDQQKILKLVEEELYADLLYPHNVVVSKVPNYKKNLKKKSVQNLILEDAKAEFGNRFYVREMINRMTAYGKDEITTFNAIESLRKDNIVFAINPRTQRLIDQFSPIIEKLSKEQKAIIQDIQNNQNVGEKKISSSTGIAENIVGKTLQQLKDMGFLNDDNSLNEQGEGIATIMGLMSSL